MPKTDILLINPPYRTKKLHIYMPMGLGYVATMLDAAGFKIKIHDMNFMGTSPRDVSRIIKEKKIAVVGITGFITQVGHIVSLVNRIKADNSSVKIVVGGSLLNGVEKYIFDKSRVDVVIRGDAEEIIVVLMSSLLEGREIPKIAGVAYRKKNDIIDNPGKAIVKDLDSIPMINRDLFEVEDYIGHYWNSSSKTRTLEVIWSRGCPYKCVYCINSVGNGRYRIRSVDNVIEEIGYIKEKYNITDVVFASEVLTVNRSKIIDLCNKIEPFGLSWTAVTRADLVDEDMIATMHNAGCRQMFVGVESADNEVLKKMRKKITIEKIDEVFNMIKKHGIEPKGGFIAGHPWETRGTMKAARDFCLSHNWIYWPSFSTAYPNTALYDQVKHLIDDEEKYIRSITNHHQYMSYLLNLTQIPTREFMRIKKKYTAETVAAFWHTRNPRFPKFLIYLVARFMLFFYHLDTIFGIDVHSLVHKLLRGIYVLQAQKPFKFVKKLPGNIKKEAA